MSDNENETSAEHPHRRLNPLTGRHIVVSPHRAKRPWLGQEDTAEASDLPSYDPKCYLCPDNERIGGDKNPDYQSTYIFDNDFPAILDIAHVGQKPSKHPLFQSQNIAGVCKVICFSPDHSQTLPDLTPTAMREIVDSWCDESQKLGKDYQWVQIFENKGAMMGCSNPHPHGQIWATDFLPDEAQTEDDKQRAYFATHGRAMLLDVVQYEREKKERLVIENDDWIVIVPYWAQWPFETLLLPRFSAARLDELNDAQRDNLGAIMQSLTRCYDALFGVSFPYSMGWHGAPFDERDTKAWQLHAHFYPPLLRSATVRKFMVGYEMMAESQRDITPEQAASRLREGHQRDRL